MNDRNSGLMVQGKRPQISTEIREAYGMPEDINMGQIARHSDSERKRQEIISAQLEGFQQEYKSLTERIVESSKESKTFVGVVGLIKQAPTVMAKAHALTNMVDLVPLVGSVKKSIFGSYAGSGVGQALSDQYQTICALNERIHEFVYNEKSGLRTNAQNIGKILRESQEKYLTEREKLQGLKETIETRKTEITPKIDLLEQKYGEKISELEVHKLELSDGKEYMVCSEAMSEISENELSAKRIEEGLVRLANLIEGKKIDLGNATTLLLNGRKMHESLCHLLEESESGVQSIAIGAEFQELATVTGKAASAFKKNFNDALAVTTSQTRVLSEMGTDIIPTSVYDLEKLVESGQNIQQAAKNFLEHHGISGQDELKETLLELSQEKKENVQLIQH